MLSQSDLLNVLSAHVSPIMARSILALSLSWSRVEMERLRPGDGTRLLAELEKGVRLYVHDPDHQDRCLKRLSILLVESGEGGGAPASIEPIHLNVRQERDVIVARGAGREFCRDSGFPDAIQIRVATAISELARNIVQYVGEGRISIEPPSDGRPGVQVVAEDDGPGIAHLDEILSGAYRSRSGMGVGLAGTKRMMDDFEIETAADRGTKITTRKYL